jgi:hypothetical protein
MDLDKQISELEGKSKFSNFGSKALFIKIGVSLILSSIILYVSKSLHVFNAQYDPKDKKIKLTLNNKKFLTTSIMFAIVIFFILGKLNLI